MVPTSINQASQRLGVYLTLHQFTEWDSENETLGIQGILSLVCKWLINPAQAQGYYRFAWKRDVRINLQEQDSVRIQSDIKDSTISLYLQQIHLKVTYRWIKTHVQLSTIFKLNDLYVGSLKWLMQIHFIFCGLVKKYKSFEMSSGIKFIKYWYQIKIVSRVFYVK